MGCCFSINFPSYDDAPKFEVIGTFKARLVDIYDGDTQTYVIRFNNEFYRVSVRVNGIDTPEIRSKDPGAIQARNRAFEILTSKTIENHTKADIKRILNENRYMVTLRCIKSEKYGRTLADVISYNGINLGDQLIKEKLAVKYDGGTKTLT